MNALLKKGALLVLTLTLTLGAFQLVSAQTTFYFHNNTDCDYNGAIEFRSLFTPYVYQNLYPALPNNTLTTFTIPVDYEVYSVEATLAGTGSGCYIGTVGDDCTLPSCNSKAGKLMTWDTAISTEINN